MFSVCSWLVAATNLAYLPQTPMPPASAVRPVARVIATIDGGEIPTWFQERQPEIEDLQRNARRQGFDLEVVEGRAYLIDQRLYDLDAKQKHFAVLEELQVALGRSGVFGVVDRPELSRLVASLFGPPSMNLEGAAEAQFTALPSVAVALNDGSKSVTVYLQPTPSAEMLRSLQERPLRPGPVTKVAPPRSESENRIGFGYTLLKGLKFDVRGRDALYDDQRARDLHVVTRLLVAKEEEWAATIRNSQTAVFHSLLKLYPDFGGAERFSGATSQLPERMRSEMTKTILDDFRGYGFSSEAEASAFLARANARSTPFLSLAAANRTASGFGLVVYSLPIP